MKRSILVVALAVTGAGVYLLLESRRTEPADVATAASGARWTARAGASGDRGLPAATARPSAPVITADATGATDAPAAERARSVPPSGEEIHDRLETAFAADRPVAASGDLARDLDQRVRTVLPAGSTLRSLECRSAMCRLETVHAGPDEFRDFAQRAFLTRGSRITSGPVFTGLVPGQRPGEPVVAVAYVGRDDATLAMAASLAPPDAP
jgi:hypothetical protein